jgi:hypothetical protein
MERTSTLGSSALRTSGCPVTGLESLLAIQLTMAARSGGSGWAGRRGAGARGVGSRVVVVLQVADGAQSLDQPHGFKGGQRHVGCASSGQGRRARARAGRSVSAGGRRVCAWGESGLQPRSAVTWRHPP